MTGDNPDRSLSRRTPVAKVSELIQQARGLEEQGETVKALAIYRHLLPFLKEAPALAAEVSVRAGDILLGDGDSVSALEMYQRAAGLAAAHGSARSVLSVGAKMATAAPDRADVYLELGRKLFEHGHAGPAVEVLLEHARRIRNDDLMQELQSLAGRRSEDIQPLVRMLLEGDVGSAPPPPPPSSTVGMDQAEHAAALFPSPKPAKPPEPAVPPPPPLPTWAASPPSAPPSGEIPALPVERSPEPPPPPPPLPSWAAPPPPPLIAEQSAEPIPPPEGIVIDPSIELGSLVPSTQRESEVFEERARRSDPVREAPSAEPPRPRRRPPRRSVPVRSVRGGRRSRGILWVLILLGLGGGAGWLVYTRGGISIDPAPPRSTQPDATPAPAAQAPPPAPAEVPPETGPPGDADPPANADPLGDAPIPPVLLGGFVVDSIATIPGVADGFRIVHRDSTRARVELTARPAADTLGEPAPGMVLLDILPGDTGSATTMFEGYVVTIRGTQRPAVLGELLKRLYLVPRN